MHNVAVVVRIRDNDDVVLSANDDAIAVPIELAILLQYTNFATVSLLLSLLLLLLLWFVFTASTIAWSVEKSCNGLPKPIHKR